MVLLAELAPRPGDTVLLLCPWCGDAIRRIQVTDGRTGLEQCPEREAHMVACAERWFPGAR